MDSVNITLVFVVMGFTVTDPELLKILTVCKMCGMHIFYALMSLVKDTTGNKTVA